MADFNLGRAGGFFSIGKVVNVKDDPTQTGKVKVQWLSGSASQGDMGEQDLPWTSVMGAASNPLTKGIGSAPTGMMVDTIVYGIPLSSDGQEYVVMGTMPKSGSGEIDQDAKYDADVPATGKVQENGGERQPSFGDKNNVVTNNSIWEYGEKEGGNGKAAKYPSLKDSIGYIDAISQDGGSGGMMA